MTTSKGQRTVIFDAAALDHALDSMALSLAARIHGAKQVTLVGVLRRGAPLADRLCSLLRTQLPRAHIQRLDLSIQRYSDDLTLLHPQTLLTEPPEHSSLDLAESTVVIVDDVLYHGFSLFKAVQYLLSKGAQTIHTALLVDRVCASLPVHADVCGLKLEIAAGDIIECHVPPYEESFQVVLVQPYA